MILEINFNRKQAENWILQLINFFIKMIDKSLNIIYDNNISNDY